MTQSTRSGGGTATGEKADMAASQLVQYAASLTNAITRMRVSNGCSDDNLNFYHESFTYDYTNPAAPVNGSCDVFGAAGGGASAQYPPASVTPASSPTTEYWFTSCMDINQVGTNTSGALSKDLTIQAFVSRDICLKLNEKLGITNTGGNPPQISYGQTDPGSANYCSIWVAIVTLLLSGQTAGPMKALN